MVAATPRSTSTSAISRLAPEILDKICEEFILDLVRNEPSKIEKSKTLSWYVDKNEYDALTYVPGFTASNVRAKAKYAISTLYISLDGQFRPSSGWNLRPVFAASRYYNRGNIAQSVERKTISPRKISTSQSIPFRIIIDSPKGSWDDILSRTLRMVAWKPEVVKQLSLQIVIIPRGNARRTHTASSRSGFLEIARMLFAAYTHDRYSKASWKEVRLQIRQPGDSWNALFWVDESSTCDISGCFIYPQNNGQACKGHKWMADGER
ncbi:hypothetical protein FKW77_002486 [Venturia effusa]|uniref:Uncharacterized protein n=1 Tax=Venturia effusa TaxID=50376 RepID=A0A517L8T5_9PEZI|nr:hypothetical protein FKW77_002486 [Venturia effusa]